MNRLFLHRRRHLLAAILSAIALLGVFSSAQAQLYTEVAGGAGSSRIFIPPGYNPNPFTDYWWTIRSQFVIRAEEAAYYGLVPGMMESVSFNFRNATPFTSRRFTIKVKMTDRNTVNSPFENTGFTTVYENGSYVWSPIAGTPTWVKFPFSTPFQWDGTSHLLFEICTYRTGYTYVWPEYEYTQVPTFYATMAYQIGDGGDYCSPYTWYPGWYSIRPVTKIGMLSGIETSFPDDVDPRRILKSGFVYDGSTTEYPRPSISFRQNNGQNINLTYRLVGPLPSSNVIYEGRAGASNILPHVASSTGLYKYEITNAVGPAAGPGGILNLLTIPGGAYRLEATYSIPGYTQTYQKEFNIAYDNDIAIRSIRSPNVIPQKYPRGVAIPVTAQLQNVGLNDMTTARCIAVIRQSPGGQEVYRDTLIVNETLTTGELMTIDFKNFTAPEVSNWSLQICAELIGAADQQAANDCLPRPAQSYIFQTLHNEEVGVSALDIPSASGQYYAKRPFTPRGRIVNGGIQDLSNIPVRLQIFRMPGRVPVYNNRVIVQDVGSEPPFNISAVEFPNFTPADAGTYEACMTTEYPGDPVANNQICMSFSVGGNMEGTYTIGTLNTGKPRNYLTIPAAVNDLYRKGVSGAVTFELTDAVYNVGDVNADQPALDLTTKIIGVSGTNTVTFKPSLQRSLSRASIALNLHSGRGVGILFGQSILSTNLSSVQFEYRKDVTWANSEGNIRFDGGSQRSIKVNLNAPTPHRAAFYLGDGSHDIELRNLIIGNAPTATASYATSLPTVSFINGTFVFQTDVRNVAGVPTTYSAGIVSRAKLPEGEEGNNTERFDTVRNDRNVYAGNEISGFGYGIVTLGIGPAIKAGVNEYRPYYNQATVIEKNLITNVRRAGIFVGFEDGARVSGNRIYGVGTAATGGSGVDASGILAGGETRYHTVNLLVDGNEISGVRGDTWTRGITVEQCRNIFPSVGAAGSNVTFPQSAEGTTIRNNVIWGLARGSAGTHMGGIHLLTQRNTSLGGVSALLVPALNNGSYFTRGDMVVGNTVVMDNDNVAGTGAVAGIGVQHGNATVVKNNAIIMRGAAQTSSFTHSALLYEGVTLNNTTDPMGVVSDRNAYQLSASAALARHIEITSQSEIIGTGAQDEFMTLSQWRAWTGRDVNSVVGNIYDDYVYQGVAPNQKLRIRTNPTPIGSLLSNRAEKVAGLVQDIDGTLRGATGQLYDIGAVEFDGRQYVSDLEVMDISRPGAYRSTNGATSDAEYIMTTAPVDVVGLIRNNGAITQNNAKVRVRVFLETAASNNGQLAVPQYNAAAVVDRTVSISLGSGHEDDVAFGIPQFTPQTYSQLTGYVVPSRLGAMSANATPRYRLEVSVQTDEYNANNVRTKDVRFYIQRAGTRILVSSRGVNENVYAGTPTANQIVGRLNADTLVAGLGRLGFYNSPSTNQMMYDVFDRANWEQRAVDYRMYRTVFVSADTARLTRYERDDLRRYLAAGTSREKKNLAVASQELPRKHVGMDVLNDEGFVHTVLRAQTVVPGNPVPSLTTYNGRRVRGESIARNSIETIVRTGFAGDLEPVPALIRPYSDVTTSGIVGNAYVYVKGDRTTTDSVMGTSAASLVHNVVYYGVDWRHWRTDGRNSGIERVLRGTIDFFETNGGTVVPVELTHFDAQARGTTVDVTWRTASEKNADHFIVERADLATAGGDPVYGTVGTQAASGNTTTPRDYVLRDRDVAAGRYLYRLVSVDMDGSRSKSEAVEVVIGGGGMAPVVIGAVHPQPTSGSSTLTYEMGTSGHVTIAIYGVTGERVAEVYDGAVAAGRQSVELPGETLASGTYTVIVRTSDGMASVPLVVRK